MTAAAYGGALYALAAEESVSKEIYDQLFTVKQVYEDNQSFIRFLDRPCADFSAKAAVLDRCFGSSVNIYLLNCLKIMAKKRLAKHTAAAADEYIKLYNRDNGIENAVVITAVPLSGTLLNKLRAKLEEMTKKTILLKAEVDPACIGGMIIRTQGKEIDGSIKNSLAQIEKRIKSAAL